MKKFLMLFTILLIFSVSLSAQNDSKNVQVLYFKANLACCKAKACNALEADLKDIVTKNYPNGNVEFVEVKLSDEANKAVVEKYKAESQTVIILKKKKKKEKSVDVTDLVKKYLQDKNKEEFEKAFTAKVGEVL